MVLVGLLVQVMVFPAASALAPDAARTIWGEPRAVLSWGPPLKARGRLSGPLKRDVRRSEEGRWLAIRHV